MARMTRTNPEDAISRIFLDFISFAIKQSDHCCYFPVVVMVSLIRRQLIIDGHKQEVNDERHLIVFFFFILLLSSFAQMDKKEFIDSMFCSVLSCSWLLFVYLLPATIIFL